MLHLCGWCASLDWASNTWTDLPALPDSALFTSGNDLRVPRDMTHVEVLGAVHGGTGSSLTQAKIESPYLLRRNPYQVQPINDGLSWDQLGGVMPIKPSLMLVAQESVRAYFNHPVSPASAQYVAVLMWLSDGNLPAVNNGEVMTVRLQAQATTAAVGWQAKTLTFSQEIPYGDYRVIGMRAHGAGLLAARLVLPGYTWRPGVPGSVQGQLAAPSFRMGGMGEVARFNSNQPPSVELLAAAGSTPYIWLDLVQL